VALFERDVLLQTLTERLETEHALLRTVRMYEQRYGSDDPRLATPLSALGALCQLRGDLEAAEQCYRRAIDVSMP
jgi:hypothetical protein